MAEDRNEQIAREVLEHVGGADNIASALHCMTRLRLQLKDDGLADVDALEKIKGVLRVQWSGGQLQVVVGQNVPKVHAAVVAMGVKSGGSVDDAPATEEENKTVTPKAIGEAILGYLSGSMVPMIPAIIAAGLFKLVSSVISPGMLGIAAADSNIVVLLDFLYDAAFHFLTIYLGFNAANKLGVTPILGAYLGGILIAPAFAGLAAEGAAFDVFGIPCTPDNYTSTVLPILISVWVMSYVERFFKRVIPTTFSTMFVPFLTMLVMTPVTLCALAPLANAVGTVISNALFAIGSAGGILSIVGGGLLAALWMPLVATGMHVTVVMLALGSYLQTGVDTFVYVVTTIALWAGYGAEFGAFLRLKDKEEKADALGYFISNAVGGVSEPFVYGMVFKHARLWLTNGIGAFVGGALAIILGVCVYNAAGSNVLNLLMFVGGEASNIVRACICAAVTFIVATVATYLFGFTKEEIGGEGK